MYNPMYDPHHDPYGPAKVRYSRTEVLHLAMAVAVLTVAFAYVDPDVGLFPTPFALLASFVAVTSGFVLHELAHKVVAQRYGHWAEFRAHGMGLGLALLLAVFVKILFAAPGAVLIRGAVTRRENGIISLVGPGTNFLIALATGFATFQPDQEAPLTSLLATVAFVNSALCLFNLLPFGPLDGRKVLAWNKPVYAVVAILALGLFIVLLTGWPIA
jgi:Zn-dependent protease